ncbi:MAG: V-type ATP synthase subunit E, partial [Candidatus Altiarchaeales archaeon]|nr:V-type ATP synthase subunit E [Candidatus Altiarchaeales archaeon]
VYVDGKYSNLIKAEIREIGDFGVIIESRDGGIRINNTLTNIIEGLKPDLKPKVAKILFQEQ